MVEKIQDIMPTGAESHVWVGSYDKAKKQMESEGFTEIDLAKNARLRIQQGKDAYVSRNGNLTSADILILPSGKPRLTRSSIISAFPAEATQTSRTGEFYVDSPELKEAYEKALEDSVEIDTTAIVAKKFGKSKVASYAFGTSYGENPDKDAEEAQDYGTFLVKADISEMPINLPNSETRPFARKLWFRYLDVRSGLIADRYLSNDINRVRGVREVSAEGASQKVSKPLILESRVADALKRKQAFEYKGIIYVPVRGNSISLKQ